MAEVIVALDCPSRREALSIVERLGHRQNWYKVGLELFTREGPVVVRELVDAGKRVFLDLKLHDIPQTVERAVAAASALGAEMATLHITGGEHMVAAARSAAEDKVLLLGVTVLTSLSLADLEVVRGSSVRSMRSEVERLGRIAIDWELSGVVLSPLEASWISAMSKGDLALVTPGIRCGGEDSDDQTRVATPAQAVEAGADFIVVGRPVIGAEDPADALAGIRAETEQATSAR